MPRPGPRPYECVRRAWHSDRHQPFRGSLIQEIFRVANEVHGSATKKNKEWQEKLPIVVLKAEEIMYSKANSEAEYMDLKTLWSRVNDAIDTIIRRDESTETGNLLQPCIEAALHLGCIPRRTSRSQRNVNPRCYMSPATQELSSSISCAMENPHLGYNSSNLQNISNCPNMFKTTMAVAQNGCCAPSKLSLPSTSRHNLCLDYPTSRGCSTIPLYYASAPPSSLSPMLEPAIASNVGHNAAVVDETTQLDLKTTRPEDCDLSLRLGPSTVSCPGFQTYRAQELRDLASEESKLSDLPLQLSKFSVLPSKKVSDPLGSSSSNWNYEGQCETRKRKTDPSQGVRVQSFVWQAKLPYHR